MKITVNETVANVNNCYVAGRTYDLPDDEAAGLIRAGHATSDEPGAAEAMKQRRARLDAKRGTPVEAVGAGAVAMGAVPDLHPTEQPDQTPADIERAGHTRGPVETVPPTNPAALDADNPLVPKGTVSPVVTADEGKANRAK